MSNETVTVNDIQIPVSALKAAGFIREVKQSGRYKPKHGKGYWYLYRDGHVYYKLYDDNDKSRFSLGNCYRTKEEATAARDKQLALVRVQDKLEELTDGWCSSTGGAGRAGLWHHRQFFTMAFNCG